MSADIAQQTWADLCERALAASPGEPCVARAAINLVAEQLGRLHPFLGRGIHRSVWDAGDVVYKAPRDFAGIDATLMEARAYADPSSYDDIPVAACTIVWHETGLPILIMETVRPATRADEDAGVLPDWSTRVDGRQIGMNAAGEWVYFDAGVELELPTGYSYAVRHHAKAAIHRAA